MGMAHYNYNGSLTNQVRNLQCSLVPRLPAQFFTVLTWYSVMRGCPLSTFPSTPSTSSWISARLREWDLWVGSIQEVLTEGREMEEKN